MCFCTEIIPRSVAMVHFEGISYLLVALGDGTLFYFNIDPNSGNISLFGDNGTGLLQEMQPIKRGWCWAPSQ